MKEFPIAAASGHAQALAARDPVFLASFAQPFQIIAVRVRTCWLLIA